MRVPVKNPSHVDIPIEIPEVDLLEQLLPVELDEEADQVNEQFALDSVREADPADLADQALLAPMDDEH